MRKATYAVLIFIAVIAFQGTVRAQNTATWNTALIDPRGEEGSLALDSNGNPHVAFTHWDYTQDTFALFANRVDYAVLGSNNSWNIQTVDRSGLAPMLKLDSSGRPHIIYQSGSDLNLSLKYAVSDNGGWGIQTVDSSERWMDYSMALDAAGHPHIVYTTYQSSENYHSVDETKSIKYAYNNGVSWDIQTIDNTKASVDFSSPSIALDSQGNPQVVYLEGQLYPYPSSAVGGYSNLESFNIKHASLSDNHWQTQTLFTNATNISNLVFNSKGQLSFCYLHNIYSVNLEYGSYSDNATVFYGYWDGQEWSTQPVYSTWLLSGTSFLHLDSNENPEVYFYVNDYQNANNSGVIYAHRTGSNWNTQNLGAPTNSSYSFDTANIVDMAFNADGKPVLLADGQVGSSKGSSLWGDLTYGSTMATLNATSSVPVSNLFIIPVAVAVTVVALTCISTAFFRKKKIQRGKSPNM